MDLLIGSLLLRPYVFLFMAAFLVAAGRDLGLRRTLAFSVIVWPVAWAAELSSIHIGFPFGLYHYSGLTRGQELYVAGVPFFDSLSFVFLAYAAYCLARRAGAALRVPPGALPLAAGFLMMMLDVVIDPAAVRGERWFLGNLFYYPQGGVYFGVPLSNFAGWWLVGAIGVGLYGVAARPGPDGAGRTAPGIALYYAVFVFNVAVTAWIGEWRLLASGAALHALMAIALVAAVRRTSAPAVLRTRRIERA